MLRRVVALSLVGITCIIAAILVASEPNQSGASGKTRIPDQGVTSVPKNSENTNAKKNGAQNQAPRWYTTSEGAEWALVFVALFTLGAIWYQARETAKAAKATKASVELQKVAMEQWVGTNSWSAGCDYIPPEATEAVLFISFKIVNPTSFKLILLDVDLWKDRGSPKTIFFRRQLLPPKEDTAVKVEYSLEGVKLCAYRAGHLRFEYGGLVRYVDAFNINCEQRFGHIVTARPGSQGEFESIAFDPPSKEEEENHKKRRAQNPI